MGRGEKRISKTTPNYLCGNLFWIIFVHLFKFSHTQRITRLKFSKAISL